MPKKQNIYAIEIQVFRNNATIKHDKWLDHCKKKHACKVKNNLGIKYKIIEFKFSADDLCIT